MQAESFPYLILTALKKKIKQLTPRTPAFEIPLPNYNRVGAPSWPVTCPNTHSRRLEGRRGSRGGSEDSVKSLFPCQRSWDWRNKKRRKTPKPKQRRCRLGISGEKSQGKGRNLSPLHGYGGTWQLQCHCASAFIMSGLPIRSQLRSSSPSQSHWIIFIPKCLLGTELFWVYLEILRQRLSISSTYSFNRAKPWITQHKNKT